MIKLSENFRTSVLQTLEIDIVTIKLTWIKHLTKEVIFRF